MKTALITGFTGQDGSYLAEILLDKGYKVVGMTRRRSNGGNENVQHLLGRENLIIANGDLIDSGSICELVKVYKPDEMYNLGAQSFVGLSWKEPYHSSLVTGLGTTNCLEAIRLFKPDCKFYQASSSELYGRVLETPQTEKTPFNPLSPYAAAKQYAFSMCKIYRESYGMFTSNGILFNHESPRRGLEFVTRKITDAVARIKVNGGGILKLGNLDAKRDWGSSKDYMSAAWLMLQQEKPDDYVISTGETHSIKEFLEVAFSRLNLDWQEYVVQDEQFMRPNDVQLLLGDSSKARKVLGWKPLQSFNELVCEMVDADYAKHLKALS